MNAYAGIGSRATPRDVLVEMTRFAQLAAARGWILRSGGAPGADQAFEDGAGERAEIFVPWPSFERRRPSYRVLGGETLERALLLASIAHPAWGQCSGPARLLHARNVAQVWGADLESPVRFVVCWAPERDGSVQGGTATAVTIARAAGIPVANLASADGRARYARICKRLEFAGERDIEAMT
jgi:hypothetical protein